MCLLGNRMMQKSYPHLLFRVTSQKLLGMTSSITNWVLVVLLHYLVMNNIGLQGVWVMHSVWKSFKNVLFSSEAMFTFWVEKCPKWSILASFWKPEGCGQTVLPDRSVLIGQKLVENAKIEKNSNATFWVIFKHCACAQVGKWEFSRVIFDHYLLNYPCRWKWEQNCVLFKKWSSNLAASTPIFTLIFNICFFQLDEFALLEIVVCICAISRITRRKSFTACFRVI